MLLQGGFVCHPAHFQKHEGDTWRQAQGELVRAVEGQQPCSRTGICSVVQGWTGESQSTARALQNDLQQATFVSTSMWHECPTASSGTCAHSPTLCSSIGFSQRTPELASLSFVPCFVHRWKQVHTEHMSYMWMSLEMLCGMLHYRQHHPAWLVWPWVSDGLGVTQISMC